MSLIDEMNLLEWRNKPEVSRLQKSTNKIDSVAHHAWLLKRIERIDIFPFFAYEIEDSVAAYTRVEPTPAQSLEISILVSPGLRGKGYGYEVLKNFVEHIRIRFPESNIVAVVHKSNTASLALFSKVGFELCKQTDPNFFELILPCSID